MKAFWWFKNDSIAGMARPGFNTAHWFDLPFQEVALLGWLGRYSSGEAPLDSFTHHLQTYVPRIFEFHGLSAEEGDKEIRILRTQKGVLETLQSLNRRHGILKRFEISNENLFIEIDESAIEKEISVLKNHGISTVVSLTEKHHEASILKQYFNAFHIGIADLGAPSVSQVQELAAIIDECRVQNHKLAVHCLAGIGRTSTMLLGAHLMLGERLEDLKKYLTKGNPSFKLTGSQGEFIHSLEKSISR